MIFSRLLSFLRGGLFGRRRYEEDFIKRIEKGDIEYILNVGVPRVDAPPTPGPQPWKELNLIATGFETTSNILKDPEALMYILTATDRQGEPLEVKGTGIELLRTAVNYTREHPGSIYYFEGVQGSIETRMLAYNGLVSGIYFSVNNVEYSGLRAVDKLGEFYFDAMPLWATRVKDELAKWSDEKLSVYVRGLDHQHMYLVNTLNSLYRSTVIGESEKVLNTILKRLVDYTKFHFRSEEILMDKYNYPQDKFLRHQREHNAFVKTVTRFKEKYDAGEADLTLDVFKFLATWIINHVAGTDRDYGLYFLQIGVANKKPVRN